MRQAILEEANRLAAIADRLDVLAKSLPEKGPQPAFFSTNGFGAIHFWGSRKKEIGDIFGAAGWTRTREGAVGNHYDWVKVLVPSSIAVIIMSAEERPPELSQPVNEHLFSQNGA